MLRFRDMQILGMLEQGSLAKLGNQVLSKLPHLSFEASEDCDDEHQMRKKKIGRPFWRLSLGASINPAPCTHKKGIIKFIYSEKATKFYKISTLL